MGERVARVDDTVRRPLESWSASVHDLLRHLETKAFSAPRVLGVEDGAEVLTWIEGESGSAGWARLVPLEGLRRWGQFLRTYHDAAADFVPGVQSVWSSGTGACGAGEIVCHGDFGPWNAVWRGAEIVGLIDWDHARPAPAVFDISYAIEYVAPFRDDETSIREMGHATSPDRRRRIETFCDGYGIDPPNNIVERVAQQQRHVASTVQHLAAAGVEPQATWVRDGFLDELADRVRFTESLHL